jgi:DNA-binding NtrC family response regulator
MSHDNKKNTRILIVEDEEDQRIRLKYVFESDGYSVDEVSDGESAIKKMGAKRYDIVVSDLKLPGEMDGLDVLRKAKNLSPSTEVFIVTAYGTVENAVQAMINGAFDYIQKPINMPEFRIKIKRALEIIETMKNSEKQELMKSNMKILLGDMEDLRTRMKKIADLADNALDLIEFKHPVHKHLTEISKLAAKKSG